MDKLLASGSGCKVFVFGDDKEYRPPAKEIYKWGEANSRNICSSFLREKTTFFHVRPENKLEDHKHPYRCEANYRMKLHWGGWWEFLGVRTRHPLATSSQISHTSQNIKWETKSKHLWCWLLPWPSCHMIKWISKSQLYFKTQLDNQLCVVDHC